MMVVAHNLLAMNGDRMLGINTNKKAKSTEKLSSGYRINRAADDAAGLAISEKMRRQIRGLTQGAQNLQDGISLCQIADGALNETQDILQRMNELCVKAANGTLDRADREYIQSEMVALKDEVDRIATTTSFNEKIFPLRSASESKVTGTIADLTTLVSPTSGRLGNVAGNIDVAGVQSMHFVLPNYQQCAVERGYSTSGGERRLDVSAVTREENAIIYEYDINSEFKYSEKIELEDNKYKFTYEFKNNSATVWQPIPDIVISSSSNKNSYQDYCSIDYDCSVSHFINEVGADYESILDYPTDGIYAVGNCTINPGASYTFSITAGPITITDNEKANEVLNNLYGSRGESSDILSGVWIQAGVENGDGLTLSFVDATSDGLGLGNPDVQTETLAMTTLDNIKQALMRSNTYRSHFGVMQNRMEHSYNVNNNTIENTTYAESRIRDTDMAKEMVAFSNQSIIQQAGQTMLAQANQSNQGVLSLLG